MATPSRILPQQRTGPSDLFPCPADGEVVEVTPPSFNWLAAPGAAGYRVLVDSSCEWGEELPQELPDFAPTPDYHQELFLYPGSLARFRDWLGDQTVYLRRRPVAG